MLQGFLVSADTLIKTFIHWLKLYPMEFLWNSLDDILSDCTFEWIFLSADRTGNRILLNNLRTVDKSFQ